VAQLVHPGPTRWRGPRASPHPVPVDQLPRFPARPLAPPSSAHPRSPSGPVLRSAPLGPCARGHSPLLPTLAWTPSRACSLSHAHDAKKRKITAPGLHVLHGLPRNAQPLGVRVSGSSSPRKQNVCPLPSASTIDVQMGHPTRTRHEPVSARYE
jgi:hypothetical protein